MYLMGNSLWSTQEKRQYMRAFGDIRFISPWPTSCVHVVFWVHDTNCPSASISLDNIQCHVIKLRKQIGNNVLFSATKCVYLVRLPLNNWYIFWVGNTSGPHSRMMFNVKYCLKHESHPSGRYFSRCRVVSR